MISQFKARHQLRTLSDVMCSSFWQNAGTGSLHLWSRCVESSAVPLSGLPHAYTQEPYRYVDIRQSSPCQRGIGSQITTAANFFSHVVKLEWIGLCCYPRECRGRIHNEIQDHRGRLPGRTHKKFFNKAESNKSNPTKKVFSVQGLSGLCSPIRVGRYKNGCRLKHRASNDACGLEIPGCTTPSQCGQSGWVTSTIEPRGLVLFSSSFLVWRLGIITSLVHNDQLCVTLKITYQ